MIDKWFPFYPRASFCWLLRKQSESDSFAAISTKITWCCWDNLPSHPWVVLKYLHVEENAGLSFVKDSLTTGQGSLMGSCRMWQERQCRLQGNVDAGSSLPGLKSFLLQLVGVSLWAMYLFPLSSDHYICQISTIWGIKEMTQVKKLVSGTWLSTNARIHYMSSYDGRPRDTCWVNEFILYTDWVRSSLGSNHCWSVPPLACSSLSLKIRAA